RSPNQHDCWISTTPDDKSAEKDHPHFGDVAEIYNVIDARQSEAQNTVIEALRGLGHNEAAEHYTHFSYEMVALTPRCAAELGYTLSAEDKSRSYIEVSGRKARVDPDTYSTSLNLSPDDLASHLTGEGANEICELWLASSKTSSIVEQCIATTEPAFLAKHVFQLAQLFNTFYHRYPILSEA